MSLARLPVGSYLVCLQKDSDVTSWVRDGLLWGLSWFSSLPSRITSQALTAYRTKS